jgi:predicted TIM-barrel fold metal-dependent hydrolase
VTTDAPPCAAPDPNPRKPRFAAPAGTCDTHAHVFGPQSRYPYSPARGYTPPDAPYEAYRRLHATLGVARGVLTQPSVYGTDNRAMLDAVAKDPANLRAVAAVGADVSDTELRRLHEAGARGIRVNLVDKGGMPFASFGEVERFAERIVPMGWHIEYLVHVHDFPELDVLGRLPADSVIGHFGYMHVSHGVGHPGFQAFLRLFAKGRIWVKMTAPYRITGCMTVPYGDVTPIARALCEARSDRLLWGTDWPHPINPKPMANDGDLFDHLPQWLPDEALQRQVLVDNPKKLYGFE